MDKPDILPDDLIGRFTAIVGANHALTERGDLAPHLQEPRKLYAGRTAILLRPGSTEEVAEILRLASQTGTPIVPQGGNTGLVGGQSPRSQAEILLHLGRLDRIREIDAPGRTMTVEAGAILANVQGAAEAAGLFFPLSLGSEGSCTIGGNLSTNAGGTAVLAYGNSRDLCLGLEVVLANGEIIHGLRRLRKDNRGYDLKDLFIGAEGTLGIITAAVLKLFPRPAGRAVAFAGVPDPAAALELFSIAGRHAGPGLTGFEFMSRRAMEFTLRHTERARDPLQGHHPWYVLCEISSFRSEEDAGNAMEAALGEALEAGCVRDAALAASLSQAADFWRLREEMSWAQIPEGGSIKHDVAVPVARVPEFLARADRLADRIAPGARPVPFGHLGDGNIHYNVSQPEGGDRAAFLALWAEMNEAIHALVLELGGTYSAEHGIGQLKAGELARDKIGPEWQAMLAIKNALDPLGILNPGKVMKI